MKRYIILALLFIPTVVNGQNNTTRFFTAYAYEALSVAGTAVPFTSTKVVDPNNPSVNSAALVTFTINCASGTTCVLRFTVDGTTPTASVGMRALYGDTVAIYNHTSIVAFRAIRETSDSLVLDTTYFR